MRELELMIRMQNPTSATHFPLSLSLARARDMSLNANAIIGAADNKTGEHRLARR